MATEDEQEVQAPQKRKRRSSAEVQAEREAIARARAVTSEAADEPLPAEQRDLTSLGAIAVLANNNVDPAEYSDIYCLMKDCIRMKRKYNLSDNRFMELMNRFDERAPEPQGRGRNR